MIKVTSNKNQVGLTNRPFECRQGDRMCNDRGSLTKGSKPGHWGVHATYTAAWAHILQPPPLHISRFILVLVLNADLVFSSVLWSLLVIFSMAVCLLLGGRRSILFRTTTMRGQVSSPISRHSAVWVCTPLTTSTTSIIRSMIWAPGEGRTIIKKMPEKQQAEEQHSNLLLNTFQLSACASTQRCKNCD